MCRETIETHDIKLRHIEKITSILFFGSVLGRLNGNLFLINAHGVLRRMGAVTENPGTCKNILLIGGLEVERTINDYISCIVS